MAEGDALRKAGAFKDAVHEYKVGAGESRECVTRAPALEVIIVKHDSRKHLLVVPVPETSLAGQTPHRDHRPAASCAIAFAFNRSCTQRGVMLRICAFFFVAFGISPSTAYSQINFVLSQVDLHAGSDTYIAPSPITIDAEHGYSASLTDSARGSTTSVAAAQIDTYRWRITVQTKGGSDGYGTAIVVFRLTLSNASPVGVNSVVAAASQSDATVQISYAGAGVYKRCVTSATEDPGECAVIPEGSSYPATTWQAPVRTARVTTGALLLLAGGQVAQNAPFDTVIVTEVLAGDTITFSNPNDPKTDLGVWVNAQTETGNQWQRKDYVSSEDIIVLGDNLVSSSPPPSGDEIVAFTARHPMMVLSNAGWTKALENKNAPPFADEIVLRIKFWVIAGTYTWQRIDAGLALARANEIWVQQGSGIRFESYGAVEDKTACGLASKLEDFSHDVNQIKADIMRLEACGYEPGMINVYLVKSIAKNPGIKGSTPRGLPPLTNNVIVLPSDTFPSSLAHELGHLFELDHVCEEIDACGALDRYLNLMIPFTNRDLEELRRTRGPILAEGQIFRAHISPMSAINNTYFARPTTQPQRSCSNDLRFPGSLECPHLLERIFSDQPR